MTLTTQNLNLSKVEAEPILNRAAETSAVLRLGKEEAIGLGGTSFPIFDSQFEAKFVGENEQKPVGNVTARNLTMTPRKMAQIIPVSNEAIRAAGGVLSASIYNDIADAFGRKIDQVVFYGASGIVDNPLAGTSKAVELGTSESNAGGIYADFVAAKGLLYGDDYDLTGVALDRKAEPLVDGAVDASGRPLFASAPYTENSAPVTAGRILGANTVFKRGLGDEASFTSGFLGDWQKVRWGILSGLSIRAVQDGTYTEGGQLKSATEHNVTLLVCEMEVGLTVIDENAFVKITNGATGA